MQNHHPYDLIAIDKKARAEFYSLCEKRIRLLKRYGFIAEAVIHAKSLAAIQSDLTALDLFE